MILQFGIGAPRYDEVMHRGLFFSEPVRDVRWIGFSHASVVSRQRRIFWWWNNSPRGLRRIHLFCVLLLGMTGVEAKIGPAIDVRGSSPEKGIRIRKKLKGHQVYGVYIQSDRRPGYNFSGAPDYLERLVKPARIRKR